MKALHQTRSLLLSWSLLVLAPWSAAQIGFLTALNRASKTATSVSEPASEPTLEPITIPAGTHLLMKLISPLHTTSSTPGSGVYLETAFPVVANSRVVIPEHTRVMGVMADERRPGRVQGRAQMQLRFTQLILPDNRELSVVGDLQSLPGSSKNRTNSEGMLEPVDQIDADVYTMVKTTGAGLLIGSLSHAGLAGVGYGAVIGGGVGLARVLFTRGDEISLPVGTRVEMILKRPLTVQPAPPSKGADSNNAPDVKPEPATARREFAGCPRSSGCDTPGTVTSSPVSFALEH
jgi:hypothetical protein